MITKRIVLLADSKKQGGRCVAGREILARSYGGWIRPVSGRASGSELWPSERQYQNGADPQLLDVIDIALDHAVPHTCHQENWLHSSQAKWAKVGTLGWNDAANLVDGPPVLWVNGSSTIAGRNDEISAARAIGLQNSICLIRVNELTIRVFRTDYAKEVRADFSHANSSYSLKITDLNYLPAYMQGPVGNYPIGECLLTISLAELYRKKDGIDYHYKLVAAIMPR